MLKLLTHSRLAPWRLETRALLALGVPMALTQLIQFSVNTVDVLMIARLGPEPLAASSLGIVMFYAGWLAGFGPAVAVSPLVSHAIGARGDDHEDVRKSVRMALWAIALLSPVIGAIYFLAEEIALALGQPPALARLAGPYVAALAPGLPFALGVMCLRNFLAAIERTHAPVFIMLGTTLLNAFLNYLLIYGNWGFPRLELVGAGVASAIAHAAGFAALGAYCYFDRRARAFDIFRDILKPDWARFREVVRLGWPISVTTAFEAMLFNACVFIMGRIGVNEVAAYQVALNVAAIGFMAPFGLSMAGCVRVGLFTGAGDAAGARRAGFVSMIVSTLAILIVAIPMMAAPLWIAGLYLDRSDPDNAVVIGLVVVFLRIAAAFALFDAAQVAANQALRGLKDVNAPMWITGVAYWGVGFPLAAYLGLATPLGAAGVWWGLLVSLILAAFLLGGRFILLTRDGGALTISKP